MKHNLVVATVVAVGLGGSYAYSDTPAAPPATPAAPVVSMFDRLHDNGPLAGMPGWSLALTANANYCGGFKLTTVKGKAKVSAADQPLVTVFALTFPSGLDFSPDHEKTKQASLKKFNDWVAKMQATGATATSHYQTDLASTDLATKLHAAARIAQLSFRLASVLARAEIPKDVRAGQFSAEYCDRMAEVAEPLLARGEEALAACAAKVPAGSTDWTATFCVAK